MLRMARDYHEGSDVCRDDLAIGSLQRPEMSRGAKSETSCGRLLILQGPVGRFFGHLARTATASGYDVLKVQFNVADQVFQRGGRTETFNAPMEQLPDWLDRVCANFRPDAIILFGDRRPVHIDACHIAERCGIALYAFEEGYMRPDFVTFERGGNNARSPLPRDPSAYRSTVVAPKVVMHVKPTFAVMTVDAMATYIVAGFGRSLFPHYRHHRQRTLTSEAIYWCRNVGRRIAATRRDLKTQGRLIAQWPKRYFVVALQVHDDLQALHHGRGWSQAGLIVATLRSFAAHAPAGTRLVFRCHPYDRGHSSHAPLIRTTAAAFGISDRVDFLQTGHAPSLLATARGFVTVNSTMSLSAMYHGCPVFALGDTFYRLSGLVAPGMDEAALDGFWNNPGTIDKALYEAFQVVVRDRSLINGSFYRPSHWPAMSAAVLDRLQADSVFSRAERRTE